MPNTPQPTSSSSSLIRVAAGVVLFSAVLLATVQAVLVFMPVDHTDAATAIQSVNASSTAAALPRLLSGLIPAMLTLVAGVAFASVLEGLARLLSNRQDSSGSAAAGQRTALALTELTTVVTGLRNSLPALIQGLVEQAQPRQGEVPESTDAADGLPSGPTVDQQLSRMVKLLEEMKELSMLDDAQRQSKRQMVSRRRKENRLEEAAGLIASRQWEQADALLHLLESLHPGDADVLAKRNELDDARIEKQADAWDELHHHVQELLGQGNYEQAIVDTTVFLEQFPQHVDCAHLLERVRAEQAAYTEAEANRVYELIKVSVENRQWRTALDGIHQFLEQFPGHGRATKIRQQIRVIQKNAEIEERHEQEDRIRDLIAQRKYAEAVELSEDLLQRFPESPQAAHLAEILPKLQDRAAAASAVSGSVFLG